MEAPEEPKREDCCNNGCNPCIFDVYEKQLKLYEKYKNSQEGQETENGIFQCKYTEFIVTDIKNLCDLHKLIKFKKIRGHHKVWWSPGDHFFILYNRDSKKCSRAYTPIKLNEQNEDFDFSIIVKLYNKGLVSNYLFELVVGDVTLWRGPYGKYDIIENQFNNIVMVAQGTGIVPIISIITEILKNEDDMTKIYLHYCCNSMDTTLFREELYSYKQFWNFKYKIYVSNEASTSTMYEEPVIKRKLEVTDLELFENQSKNQYLICGSNNFMTHFETLLLSENVSVNIKLL